MCVCVCTGVKRFLLYARRSEIRGVDIDNPYLNVIMALTVPDIDDVTSMDYDAVEERIYWADVKSRTIKRAFINGTQLQTVMSGGTSLTVLSLLTLGKLVSVLLGQVTKKISLNDVLFNIYCRFVASKNMKRTPKNKYNYECICKIYMHF